MEQQLEQYDLNKTEEDITEIKISLLQMLKTNNPRKYLEFLGQLNLENEK